MTRIICVASGSGGHIIPCLTIAERERKIRPDLQVVFVTSRKKLDADLVVSHPVVTHAHLQSLFSCSLWHFWNYPRLFFNLMHNFYTAYVLLSQHKPLKIVSMGGFISIPICLAGWLQGIPIELYELNAIPGKAVRLLSFFAQRIFICFTSANRYLKSEKCIFTPYPIRFDTLVKNGLRSTDKQKKTMLILGGSQGSQFINTFFTEWLSHHKDLLQFFDILHQAGTAHAQKIKNFYAHHQIEATVFDFADNICELYQQADLVICRSGAGTLFELLFFEKKCITIPLEGVAGDHQSANAHALTQQYPHLVTVLTQKELLNDPEIFMFALTMIFDQDGQLSGFEPKPYT
jgi:UDP-N-acetylglucosamine--N-acetylmuramyl-(pentapeptide) pyrophosphoryl-undecaprenol N-acetylglucosamine transferase